METKKSKIHMYGQVWYWQDAIYGKKEDGVLIDSGESTVRYSRYVIIAQTDDTISNSSVLVIPCSSNRTSSHDVMIPVAYASHHGVSYARVRSVFPVSVKSLEQYICTLPENTMKYIEAELIKVFAPSVVNNMKRSYSRVFGKMTKEVPIDLSDDEYVDEEVMYLDQRISIKDVPAGISKLANTIKLSLQSECIYDELDQYTMTTEKYSYPENFYYKLGSMIYHTLLEFVNIRKTSSVEGGFLLPRIQNDDPKLGMYYMLERFHTDKRIKADMDGKVAMKVYRKHYGAIQYGLELEWLKYLKSKIINKLLINESGAEAITSLIEKIYCKK